MRTAARIILSLVAVALAAWAVNGEMEARVLRDRAGLSPTQCVDLQDQHELHAGASADYISRVFGTTSVTSLAADLDGHEVMYLRLRAMLIGCEPLA